MSRLRAKRALRSSVSAASCNLVQFLNVCLTKFEERKLNKGEIVLVVPHCASLAKCIPPRAEVDRSIVRALMNASFAVPHENRKRCAMIDGDVFRPMRTCMSLQKVW